MLRPLRSSNSGIVWARGRLETKTVLVLAVCQRLILTGHRYYEPRDTSAALRGVSDTSTVMPKCPATEVSIHLRRLAFLKGKGKGFPYSLPSVGPGADSGVQAGTGTISHPPGGRLQLLSARLAVTFPAAVHHRPLPVPSYTAYTVVCLHHDDGFS